MFVFYGLLVMKINIIDSSQILAVPPLVNPTHNLYMHSLVFVNNTFAQPFLVVCNFVKNYELHATETPKPIISTNSFVSVRVCAVHLKASLFDVPRRVQSSPFDAHNVY